MTVAPLVLGGTTEATALCGLLANARIAATVSYAGRVAKLKPQLLPHRVGGFGGVDGLARYIRDNGVTHLVDATHPFAAEMSRNAVQAATAAGIPLVALTRPPWTSMSGDNWRHVRDIPAAAEALAGPGRTVFLAVGRMHLSDFATMPQHRYVLRLVDAPDGPLPLPDCHVEIARGPFDLDADIALLKRHGATIVVSKNAGGKGAYAKIAAARALGIDVIMIDRPALPDRAELHDPAAVLHWLGHSGTERGV